MNTTAAFSWRRFWLSLILGCVLPSAAFAGFPATEVFLPAVGRIAGAGSPPAQFYTTVWATNLTNANETFTFEFLKQGQANTSPVKFSDTLSPGQTKVYENIVEDKLGLSSAIGAARVTSSGEIMLSERIYNQLPGDDVGNSEGLFFAGLPKSFSISLGQSATIQGVDQGGSEDFRYNFALVETGGGTPTVHVALVDGDGNTLGSHDYILQPYEQLQPNVTNLFSTVSTINARITAMVTAGTGSVLLAGAQVANQSQDSSGFEMSFRGELLGSGGTAGVTSLNGLTGTLALTPGSGIQITPVGTAIQIAYTGGGGSGLTQVTHDASLAGQGTGASPLAIANGQVVRSLNGLHDAVALQAGSNVTITPSGSTLTIASSGGGGGLTLPYSGTSPGGGIAFEITNAGTGDAIQAHDSDSLHSAVAGIHSAGGTGTYGSSVSGSGIRGVSGSGSGVRGESSTGIGVFGTGSSDTGVYGEGYLHGVYGFATSSFGSGVAGLSGGAQGVGVNGIADMNSQSAGVFDGGITVINGSKGFVEPHPIDPTREIRYVCLEGPENGTYFRGTAHIVNGFATIEVPEHFRMVSRPEGLTVQLTPVREMAVLAVVSRSLEKIVVQGSSDVEFDYMINGVRATVPRLDPIESNRFFVPRGPHDKSLTRPLDPEVRARLVRSGILNADGSINLETAHRLGWDQQESWKRTEAAQE
jgi:hypothetical protein